MCAIASSPSPSSSASLRSAGVSPGLCTEAGETAGIPLAGVRGEGALDEDDGEDDAGEAATAGIVDDGADFKALRLLVSIRRVSPSREGPGAG